jgi:hypothetical protein
MNGLDESKASATRVLLILSRIEWLIKNGNKIDVGRGDEGESYHGASQRRGNTIRSASEARLAKSDDRIDGAGRVLALGGKLGLGRWRDSRFPRPRIDSRPSRTSSCPQRVRLYGGELAAGVEVVSGVGANPSRLESRGGRGNRGRALAASGFFYGFFGDAGRCDRRKKADGMRWWWNTEREKPVFLPLVVCSVIVA